MYSMVLTYAGQVMHTMTTVPRLDLEDLGLEVNAKTLDIPDTEDREDTAWNPSTLKHSGFVFEPVLPRGRVAEKELHA
jgi:hypothetical protein